MGYVIQDGGLFPHMTARENVELMARHLRWDENRIATRLAVLVELTHFPEDGPSAIRFNCREGKGSG